MSNVDTFSRTESHTAFAAHDLRQTSWSTDSQTADEAGCAAISAMAVNHVVDYALRKGSYVDSPAFLAQYAAEDPGSPAGKHRAVARLAVRCRASGRPRSIPLSAYHALGRSFALGDDDWRAEDFDETFQRLMKRALGGRAQVVRGAGEIEVIVLSKELLQALLPSAKEYLLRGGPGSDDNDLMDAIEEGRSAAGRET